MHGRCIIEGRSTNFNICVHERHEKWIKVHSGYAAVAAYQNPYSSRHNEITVSSPNVVNTVGRYAKNTKKLTAVVSIPPSSVCTCAHETKMKVSHKTNWRESKREASSSKRQQTYEKLIVCVCCVPIFFFFFHFFRNLSLYHCVSAPRSNGIIKSRATTKKRRRKKQLTAIEENQFFLFVSIISTYLHIVYNTFNRVVQLISITPRKSEFLINTNIFA